MAAGTIGLRSRVTLDRNLIVLGVLLVASAPGALAGQGRGRPPNRPPTDRPPIDIVGGRGLRFGRIFRGTPTRVPPDANQAAQFAIPGRDAVVQVTFLLPSGLVSKTGEFLPVQFGAVDGLMIRKSGSVTFDPNVPLTIVLQNGDRVTLRLGGTALPSLAQPLEKYDATLTIMLTDLGT